jgi:hypothetical protein
MRREGPSTTPAYGYTGSGAAEGTPCAYDFTRAAPVDTSKRHFEDAIVYVITIRLSL